jgi:hypothetical protein
LPSKSYGRAAPIAEAGTKVTTAAATHNARFKNASPQ